MPRRYAPSRFFLTTFIAVAALGATGCGGGLPLLHSVQTLPPGRVTAGAGLSGQVVLKDLPENTNPASEVQQNTLFPAIAPWVSARAGLPGSNEAGLTYSGRAVRLDGRHAFQLNKKNSLALSVGLGGEVLLTGRPQSNANEFQSLVGGGFDVPILFGWRSTAGLYSAWIGPRPSILWVKGSTPDTTSPSPDQQLESMSARDVRLGFVAGLSLGFRHIRVAMELGGAYHVVTATHTQGQKSTPVAFNLFSLTPAAALVFTF